MSKSERPDLEAITARATAATASPWEVWEGHPKVMAGPARENRLGRYFGGRGELAEFNAEEVTDDVLDDDGVEAQAVRDATFVAHARQDIPTLVTYILHLEKELGRRVAATTKKIERRLVLPCRISKGIIDGERCVTFKVGNREWQTSQSAWMCWRAHDGIQAYDVPQEEEYVGWAAINSYGRYDDGTGWVRFWCVHETDSIDGLDYAALTAQAHERDLPTGR